MQNWVPYQINKEGKQWKVTWLCLGDHLFKEPFFEESVQICKRLEVNRGPEKMVTDLIAIKQACEGLEAISPTAFIFHISRCGSTLMTQLLSLQDENIVISEAPVLDTILRLKFNGKQINPIFKQECLKSMVHILGQKRFDFQKHYYIKWDSWHLFFLDELRRAYPAVPFVFLSREKEKVLDSHRKIPGLQAIRGVLEPAIFGLELKQVLKMTPDEYMDLVVSKMIQTTHDFIETDHNSLLLPYEDGARINYEKMRHYLNIGISEEDGLAVDARLKFHSKRPYEQFEPVP